MTMFLKSRRLLLIACATLAVASCRTREVAYIADAPRDSVQEILNVYTQTIMPGDVMYIHVASQTPESVVPFNQETRSFVITASSREYNDTSIRAIVDQADEQLVREVKYVTADVSGYLVKDNGTIDFPVLGKINVAGLTQDSLQSLIATMLVDGGYVNDPQVTSRLQNYRITVLGEVRSPRQLHADGTRMTILEALAICGDINEYGKRDNVVVMRYDGGKEEIAEVDLTKKELFDSPYYYLHNNDIIYVEPIDRRKRSADINTDIPQYIGIGVNIASLTAITWNRIQQYRMYNR